ncbi:hypothetical protein ScPMuIL_002392 [Solemya velum]
MGGKLSRLRDTINKKRNAEETGHDPAVDGAKLEDRFYNNDSFKSPGIDPADQNQQEAALAIQTKYRQHAAQKEVEVLKEEDAAVKIQAGFRGYQDRQKVLEIKDPEQYNKQKKELAERLKHEEEEVDIDLTDPEVEKAAVKIQAGFKGFKARKDVQEQKEPEPPAPAEEEVDIDLNDPEVAKAANMIQAGFRKHLKIKK